MRLLSSVVSLRVDLSPPCFPHARNWSRVKNLGFILKSHFTTWTVVNILQLDGPETIPVAVFVFVMTPEFSTLSATLIALGAIVVFSAVSNRFVRPEGFKA